MEDWIGIISLSISLLSSVFTLYVFLAHNKKLSEQQKLLNTIALEKAKQEEIDNKSANIILKVDKNSNPHKLIIANNGKSTAYTIIIKSDEKTKDPLFYCNPSPSWPELKPGQSLEQPIIISNLTASQVQYYIAWTDDSGEHSDSQVVYY